MSYSPYIFQFPAGMPDLTFAQLGARLNALCDPAEHPRCTSCELRIGTTVHVRWHGRDRAQGVSFRLYDTLIARIGPQLVWFPEHGDGHTATTYWTERIAADNRIGSSVYRIRRRKADRPGPAVTRGLSGLLVIDGSRDRPVEGYAYPVGEYGAEPWCNHDGPGAVPGRRCECGEVVPRESDYSRRRRAELAAAVAAWRAEKAGASR